MENLSTVSNHRHDMSNHTVFTKTSYKCKWDPGFRCAKRAIGNQVGDF